jgi:hypothetical protein
MNYELKHSSFTYKLSQESNRCFAATQIHTQVYPDQYGDTMLSCLLAGHQNCTLAATKPLVHSKKERKKADLSLHANSIHHHPRGYAAFEEHITSLFPSSENEGFSQEFQSLGAQANS